MQGTLELPVRAALRRAEGRIVSEAAHLAAVLRRERARADRSGNEFCIVLLGLRGSPDAPSVAHMAELVAGRARETDEVAVVAGRLVCAVLPDTPAEGGRRFAVDIRASLNGEAERAVLEVLSYPSAPADAIPADNTGGAATTFDGDGRGEGKGDPGGPLLLSTLLQHVAPELGRR